MGHDISGFRKNNTNEEIAYLRRSAFDRFNKAIYDALDCNDCNGGVSGNGKEKQFSKNELIKALDFLKSDEECELERKFLSDCLANINDNEKILIHFR